MCLLVIPHMMIKLLFAKGKQKRRETKIYSVCLTSLQKKKKKKRAFQAPLVLDDTEKYVLGLCLENLSLQVVRKD